MAVQRARYMTREAIASLSDDQTVSPPAGQLAIAGHAGESARPSYTTLGDTTSCMEICRRGPIVRPIRSLDPLPDAFFAGLLPPTSHRPQPYAVATAGSLYGISINAVLGIILPGQEHFRPPHLAPSEECRTGRALT